MAGQYDPNSPSVSIPLYNGAIGPSTKDFIDTAIDGFIHPFDTLTGKRSVATGLNTTGQATQGAVDVAKGTGTLLSIVTDLPRVGTILVGGLLITAGLFALASGSKTIQIIQQHLKP